MKRIITITVLALACIASYAQKADWANFSKYSEANSKVDTKPVAVLMGDSITELWARTDGGFFTSHNYIGRGISGQCVSQMVCRFQDDVVALHPKVAVILGGTNDIARNEGWSEPDRVVSQIKSMCDIAKANGIVPIICSVLPCDLFTWRQEIKPAQEIVRLNADLKALADKEGIIYVDYHSALAGADGELPAKYTDDHCHPLLSGYEIMEEILVPYIEQAAKAHKKMVREYAHRAVSEWK